MEIKWFIPKNAVKSRQFTCFYPLKYKIFPHFSRSVFLMRNFSPSNSSIPRFSRENRMCKQGGFSKLRGFSDLKTRYELASTRLIKINCVFGCQKIAAGAIQHFAPLIHHLMTDNVPNLLKTKSSGKTIWVLFKNVSKKTPSTWHNSSAPLQKSVKVNWTELWLRIRVIFELLLFFNYIMETLKNNRKKPYFFH